MSLNKSKNADTFFSFIGIGEVIDLDNLKGGRSRPSGLMSL
jgi:hypothetical protein